ncbi:MAG: type II toxin-antitoxin system RelE/ParE family toxin [Asticcacaulis sp.]
MQVIFTPLAERQIDALHRYIAESSGFESRADQYIERIIAYCISFETFPERGTIRDDLMPGLRTIGFERRVTIAYVVAKDTVLIEAIYYAGQDFEASFHDETD